MNKNAFTLIELMVAVLLSSLVVLMIAGTLNSTARAWEHVQQRIGENYSHRTALDLIRRQSSSIYYRRDAEKIARSSVRNNRRNPTPPKRGGRTSRDDKNPGKPTNPNPNQNSVGGFKLPEGASFFEGNDQELKFLSTVSFLSDFPGQVAVRYFVAQGDIDEEGQLSIDAADQVELSATSELEGGLYLTVEERNLFLISTSDPDPTTQLDLSGEPKPEESAEELDELDLTAETQSTQEMVIMGPLRHFAMRYRRPAKRRAEEADEGEDWAEVWDMEEQNGYPSAIEFTLFYETPGITDDVETEDLPGIRMVIPLYDTQNLRREDRDVPF